MGEDVDVAVNPSPSLRCGTRALSVPTAKIEDVEIEEGGDGDGEGDLECESCTEEEELSETYASPTTSCKNEGSRGSGDGVGSSAYFVNDLAELPVENDGLGAGGDAFFPML